jgi:hypothetical protein
VLSTQIGGLLVKLAPKVLNFTMNTLACWKTLSESYATHAFHVKSAKNDLKPTDFLKRNFYFETEGVTLIKFTPKINNIYEEHNAL